MVRAKSKIGGDGAGGGAAGGDGGGVAAALVLAALGGVASAAQSLANADLGERLGSPVLGAVVNNVTAVAILLVVLAFLPAARAGLRSLLRSALPWWSYLGGLGGGLFVVGATYAVPALGVAVFTIAQVAANSVGALAVDRAGLAPTGRLGLTAPRLAGAGIGVLAVAAAQVGRPVGDLALGALALTAAAGFGVALQAALNARVAAASTTAGGVAVNMAVSTPLVVGVALAASAFSGLGAGDFPGNWLLYVGGPLGLFVITTLLVGVRAAGVLRTSLAIVGGQLAGAIVLDVTVPGGPGATPAMLVGAVLTVAAVAVTGLRPRPSAAI